MGYYGEKAWNPLVKSSGRKLLILILVVLSVGLILHQYLAYGKIFWEEDIHHETFIVAFLFCAIVFFLLPPRFET